MNELLKHIDSWYEQKMGDLGADEKRPSSFNASQFFLGLSTELKNTDESMKAIKVTIDHLVEDPAYYDKLHMDHADKKESGPSKLPASHSAMLDYWGIPGV
jgi:hypothetical protein